MLRLVCQNAKDLTSHNAERVAFCVCVLNHFLKYDVLSCRLILFTLYPFIDLIISLKCDNNNASATSVPLPFIWMGGLHTPQIEKRRSGDRLIDATICAIKNEHPTQKGKPGQNNYDFQTCRFSKCRHSFCCYST